MEWYIIAIILFSGLLISFASGIPIAFAFGILNIVSLYILLGPPSLMFIALSTCPSISAEVFLAIPFFLVIGYVFLNTGLIRDLLDNLEILLKGVPTCLTIVAIVGGLILGALTGVSVASTAALAGFLGPEMMRRGYSKPMTLGPILGAGTMANLIPPTLSSVMIGGMAGISVAGLLIGGIIPGVIISAIYIVYCILRVKINPKLGPSMEQIEAISGKHKMLAAIRLLPLVVPIFAITGVILVGIATPTEAGGTGALAVFGLAYVRKKLSWQNVKSIALETARTSTMIYFIMAGAKAYSQIVVLSGLGPGFENMLSGSQLSPMVLLALIWFAIVFIGMFVDQVSVIFLCLPMVTISISALHLDPVFGGVTFAMLVGLGGISPPFGLNLFAAKAVLPDSISMGDIYSAAAPFCAMQLIALVVVALFPILILWLPGVFGV